MKSKFNKLYEQFINEDSKFVNIEDNKNKLKETFDSIEGNGFYDKSVSENDNYSIKHAINKFKTAERNPAYDDLDDYIPGVSIYGNGGINRYKICYNGDIVFSEYHADKKDVDKAKKIGFKIS